MTKIIHGVGLVMHCRTTQRYFLLEELKAKPELCKQAGMLSFPFETRKDLELGWKKTAVRGLREELGIRIGNHEISDGACLNPKDPLEINYSTGWTSRIYVVFLEYEQEFRQDLFQPEDDDVAYGHWANYAQICAMVRQEGVLRHEMRQALDFVASAQGIKLPV